MSMIFMRRIFMDIQLIVVASQLAKFYSFSLLPSISTSTTAKASFLIHVPRSSCIACVHSKVLVMQYVHICSRMLCLIRFGTKPVLAYSDMCPCGLGWTDQFFIKSLFVVVLFGEWPSVKVADFFWPPRLLAISYNGIFHWIKMACSLVC